MKAGPRNREYLRARRIRRPAFNAYSTIKSRARREGLDFDLTEEWLLQLFRRRRCAYCGRATRMPGGRFRPDSGTIDRVDPRKGYVKANVALACHRCNARKGDFTEEELRKLADRVQLLGIQFYLYGEYRDNDA